MRNTFNWNFVSIPNLYRPIHFWQEVPMNSCSFNWYHWQSCVCKFINASHQYLSLLFANFTYVHSTNKRTFMYKVVKFHSHREMKFFSWVKRKLTQIICTDLHALKIVKLIVWAANSFQSLSQYYCSHMYRFFAIFCPFVH